jgi:hypothetical protein
VASGLDILPVRLQELESKEQVIGRDGGMACDVPPGFGGLKALNYRGGKSS